MVFLRKLDFGGLYNGNCNLTIVNLQLKDYTMNAKEATKLSSINLKHSEDVTRIDRRLLKPVKHNL